MGRSTSPELLSSSPSHEEKKFVEKSVDAVHTPQQQTTTNLVVGKESAVSPSLFYDIHKLLRKSVVGPKRRKKSSSSEKAAAAFRQMSRKHRSSDSQAPSSMSQEVQVLVKKALVSSRKAPRRSNKSRKRSRSKSLRSRKSSDHELTKPDTDNRAKQVPKSSQLVNAVYSASYNTNISRPDVQKM